jgi:hypothetical protein
LKKPFTKNRAGGVAQGIGFEFKPQYYPKKKKKFALFSPKSKYLKLCTEIQRLAILTEKKILI